MCTRAHVGVLLVAIALLPLGCRGGESDTDDTTDAQMPPDSTRRAVEQAIASLSEMRESLATSIDTPLVDTTSLIRVCRPVTQRAKTIAAENGWVIHQIAEKYRNPAHRLDDKFHQLYQQFVDSTTLDETWSRAAREGVPGWRYARRITVRPSCLVCHGDKEQRPEFVKNEYPDDKAYGYEVGDLRGLYTVFVPARIPDTTATVRPKPVPGRLATDAASSIERAPPPFLRGPDIVDGIRSSSFHYIRAGDPPTAIVGFPHDIWPAR